MIKPSKRILPFLLLVTLAFPACNSQGGESSGSSGKTEKANPTQESAPPTEALANAGELVLPLSTTGETLVVATLDIEVADLTFVSGNYPVLEELEKRTGIKIEWEVDKTDYHTIMSTRIAAASNLPDIIMLPKDVDPIKLSKNNVILKMNDLIEDYAPNIKKLLDETPEVRKALVAPDGVINFIPGTIDFYGNDYNVLGLAYRLDWIEKLGLTEPLTIEDWYEMLVAFKEQDPNGNNAQDEIPFVAGGIDAIWYFSQAYGMAPRSQWFSVNENGEVEYSWMLPGAKDYLAEMNKWWAEELIDQGMMVAHYDKAKAYMVGNIGGAASGWANRNDENSKTMQADYPEANWVLAAPPKGPTGIQAYEVDYPVKDNRYSITKDAKNPELAMKWLDYIFASDEGKMLFNFGVEDVSYKMVNGKPEFTDLILKNETYPSPATALASLGVSRLPRITMQESKAQISTALSSPESIKRVHDVQQYYKYVFPPVLATADESNEIVTKMADITTYCNEMQSKFILGTASLDNYDEFVEELKGMGIEDVLLLKQEQYNRWINN